jgi:glyoxylase-like metal-dependent hydrolase (beta-lactamase superfamily II)
MTTPTATTPTLRAKVFSSPFVPFESAEGTFSPTTSTLFFGATEAVLIDAQHLLSDVAALADIIEKNNRQLTTIYITHAHADHWYGIGELLKKFPDARPVATADVIEHINETADLSARQWQTLFGDRVVEPSVIPGPLTGSTLDLEGAELRIVEVGQGDIAPSTVVHAPSIDTVVGADVVYNQIHVMMGFITTASQWQDWIRSLDLIEALGPKMIVAGHKHPDASDWEPVRMLDETRSYITDFAEVAEYAGGPDEVVRAMKTKYPTFGNPWTLHYSAQSWFEHRRD